VNGRLELPYLIFFLCLLCILILILRAGTGQGDRIDMLPGPADGDLGNIPTVCVDLCRDDLRDEVDGDLARMNGRVCTGSGFYIL